MVVVLDDLSVMTLGRFSIRRNQNVLNGGNWKRRRVCELFKLLLSAEQHRLHREQVQDLLWPDFSSEQAANSFGKTLYLLRRALEPDLPAGQASAYITLDQDIVLLVPENIKVDADIFEARSKQIQVRTPDALEEFDAVLTLYGGDYLPDDPYEDWAQRRRDRLRRIYSWLLEQAARRAIACAQGQRASEYLGTLVEQNPLEETAHRELIRIYARIGRRGEALNQYQRLRKILQEELGTTPTAETCELYHSIQDGHVISDLSELQVYAHQPPSSLAHVSAPVHIHAFEGERGSFHRKNLNGLALPHLQFHFSVPATSSDPLLEKELVGRSGELRRLQQAYTQSYNDLPWIFFISGEAGIGKTRLARECASWVQEQQAPVLWGTCDELGSDLPYQPVIDMLTAHLRTCNPQHLSLLLGQNAADLAKIIPELRTIFTDLPASERSGQEVERRNLYNAVVHYLQAIASGGRLLIVLDDLQWVDTATTQLLSYLIKQSAHENVRTPVLLLFYRADEVHEAHPLRSLIGPQLRTGRAEEMRLKRLNEEEVQQLLTQMAGHEVHTTFAEEIYKHTEGNPFFIGESFRVLMEEGKLKKIGERWQTTISLKELALPQSVRLLIERRLTNLSPECRITLAYAALLGRHFHSSLLCQIRGLPEEQIAGHLDEAIRTHILTIPVEYVPGQDTDLLFTHDKIREVLTFWLNPLRRRTAHRQIAVAIQEHYTSRLRAFYRVLAYHYQMAEERTQAATYLQKAAEEAMHVYAFGEAADLLEKAVELLGDEENRFQRAEVLRKLSVDAYLYNGQVDRAIAAGLAASELWQALGNPAKEAESRLDVAFSFHWMGKEQEALEQIKRVLACLEKVPEELRLRAKAHVQWGLAATNRGDVPRALQELCIADELHAGIDRPDPFISVVSLWARSWCAFLSGTLQEMLDYALQSAELCRTIRMYAWEPMMTYSAAWALMLMGRLHEAAQTAHETLEKAHRHRAVGAQGWANLVLSFVAIQRGEWEKAEHFAQETVTVATLMHDADLLARAFWGRSICAGWEGDWKRSIEHSQQALRIVENDGETSLVYPYLLLQAAKAHFHAGAFERAQDYLGQALTRARTLHYRQLMACGQCLQGRILQALDHFEEAQNHFELALAELADLHDEVEYARTRQAYGLYLQARNQTGDQQCGEELLQEANALFHHLGING